MLIYFNNQNYNNYFCEVHEFPQHLFSFAVILQVFQIMSEVQGEVLSQFYLPTPIIYGQLATSKMSKFLIRQDKHWLELSNP